MFSDADVLFEKIFFSYVRWGEFEQKETKGTKVV